MSNRFQWCACVSLLFLMGCGHQATSSYSTENFWKAKMAAPESIEAAAILSGNCASCHQSGSAGGLTNILNFDSLVLAGWVTPGKLDSSLLLQAVLQNRMPPSGALSNANKLALEQWILLGFEAVSNSPTPPPPTTPPGPPDPIPLPGNDLNANALAILNARCATCHASGIASGGILISNGAQMVADGIVVAKNPSQSQLLQAIVANRMPPGGSGIPSTEIQILTDWINADPANSGELPPPTLPPLGPTFKSIQANILVPKCLGCHNSTQAKDGVDVSSYVKVMKIVKANSPSSSKLYKVTSSKEMPPKNQGYAAVSAAEVTAISNWILAGALNN